jgi:hypothetical protein
VKLLKMADSENNFYEMDVCIYCTKSGEKKSSLWLNEGRKEGRKEIKEGMKS